MGKYGLQKKDIITKYSVDEDDSIIVDTQIIPTIYKPEKINSVNLFGLDKQLMSLNTIMRTFRLKNIPDDIKRILPKGAVLIGPPGVGKTTALLQIAKKNKVPVIVGRVDEILDMYLGESEKRMRDIFKIAKKIKPCIIMFDDGDALLLSRETASRHEAYRGILQVFFQELDQINSNEMLVFVTTNQVLTMDEAVIDRLSLRIDFEIPSFESRYDLIKDRVKHLILTKEANKALLQFAGVSENISPRTVEKIIGHAYLISHNGIVSGQDIKTSIETFINKTININEEEDFYEEVKPYLKAQRLWEKGNWHKKTFITGELGELILILPNYDNSKSIINLLTTIKKKEKGWGKISYSSFKRNVRGLKSIGILDYSSRNTKKVKPINITNLGHKLILYLKNLDNNPKNAINKLERILRNSSLQKSEVINLDKFYSTEGPSISTGTKRIDKKFKEILDPEIVTEESSISTGTKSIDKESEKTSDMVSNTNDHVYSSDIKNINTKKYKQIFKFVNNLANNHKKENSRSITTKNLFKSEKFFIIFNNLNQIDNCNSIKEAAELLVKIAGGKFKTYSVYLNSIKRDGIIELKDKIKISQNGQELIKYINLIGSEEIQKMVIYEK